jgi:Tol biopolymer transport system component
VENVLKGTKLESPIPPFGGAGDFDISETHVAFVSKDPELKKAFHTKQNLYIAELKDLSKGLKQIKVPGLDGATSTPVFSPDGKYLSFLAMRQDGYESDKNQIGIYDIANGGAPKVLYGTDDHIGKWDRSPGSLIWSENSSTLFITASDNARVKVFSIPLDTKTAEATSLPKNVFSSGSVSGELVLI